MLFLRQVVSDLSFTNLKRSCSGRFPWNASRGFRRRSTFSNSRRDTSEEESEYEFDPDKARESLRELDEQLQSLSTKQINPPSPRLKAAPYKVDEGEKVEIRVQRPVLNESFLSYTTFVLLAFTIFYNVLFATVIKPAIDGPDDPAELEAALSSFPNENPAPTRLDIIQSRTTPVS